MDGISKNSIHIPLRVVQSIKMGSTVQYEKHICRSSRKRAQRAHQNRTENMHRLQRVCFVCGFSRDLSNAYTISWCFLVRIHARMFVMWHVSDTHFDPACDKTCADFRMHSNKGISFYLNLLMCRMCQFFFFIVCCLL